MISIDHPVPSSNEMEPLIPDAPQKMAHFPYSTETIALLGIGRLRGIGFQTMYRLGGRQGIRRLLATKDVLAFDQLITDAGGRFSAAAIFGDWNGLRRQIWQMGIEMATTLVANQVHFCFDDDPTFPRTFLNIDPFLRPKWIFYKGTMEVLERPCVTVVGTREPSPDGEFLARYVVSCAQGLGLPVVSGLARGIDRVVHEWCLRLQLPTISVLGTGILTPYPAKHASLGDEIVKAGGLLISEYLPDQGPSGENFVWRNRLQSALGRVVIPAEWSRRSGTAHTVGFARRMKRPVFSVSLTGVETRQDAGIGDRHFDLPGDHSEFIDALAESAMLKPNENGNVELVQYNFFGDAEK